MKAPSLHPRESERLQKLRSYRVLDTLPEKIYDDIVLLAAQICQVPTAVISLVDSDRQWFKSKINLDPAQTSREISFCGHAILEFDVMEVNDTLNDERFRHNPLVTEGPKIRFYAGAQLMTPDGFPLGTLCVSDQKPRELNEGQRQALRALSRLVVEQLEARRSNLMLSDVLSRIEQQQDDSLEHRQEALGQLARGVAHEINNPLAIISGRIMIMEQKAQRKEDLTIDLAKLKNAVERVAQVVQDMRSFAREHHLLRLQEVNLKDILEEIQAQALSLSPRPVTIRWEMQKIAVRVDAQALREAIGHVLRNAIEASVSGQGTVSVRSFAEGTWAVIEVEDRGQGISDEVARQMMTPFFTTKEPGQGMGLGLSIAHGIVMAHGGSLQLKSQRPTIFRIQLPKR